MSPTTDYESNGMRPYERRARRPLVGPTFTTDQMAYLQRVEDRITALELKYGPILFSTQPPNTKPSEPAPPILPTEAELVARHESEPAFDVRLKVATPAMLSLLGEAALEKREALIQAIAQDQPAAVRLAAMRKIIATP